MACQWEQGLGWLPKPPGRGYLSVSVRATSLPYLRVLLAGSVASYVFNDPLVPSLGASGAIFGLVGAMIVLGRRMRMPLGWVVDRYGVKWPYAICFALWCFATLAIGLVDTLAGLICLRLIVGAAEAVVVPASWRWMRTHFEEGQSGTAVGIFMFGTKIGPALGAPLAAWLIVHFDWRAMFFIVGSAGSATRFSAKLSAASVRPSATRSLAAESGAPRTSLE